MDITIRMVDRRPLNVRIAAALAILGGLISFVIMSAEMGMVETQDRFSHVIATALFTSLFFGIAGQLLPNGKGKYIPLIILNMLNVLTIAAVTMIDVKNRLVQGMVLLIVAISISMLLLPHSAEGWMGTDGGKES